MTAKTAKKPQDHKTKRHPKNELFEFAFEVYDVESGELETVSIRVPYIENIEAGLVEELASAGEEGALPVLFGGILSEKDRALQKRMSVGDLQDFVEAWNAASAIALGEL